MYTTLHNLTEVPVHTLIYMYTQALTYRDMCALHTHTCAPINTNIHTPMSVCTHTQVCTHPHLCTLMTLTRVCQRARTRAHKALVHLHV